MRALIVGLGLLAMAMAGCGDRLSQGDRVVLTDPSSDHVAVEGMPDHTSANAGIAAYQKAMGTATTGESVAAGSRATVASDAAAGGESRPVKVNLTDPPYAGLTGTVARKNLRKE